MLHIVIAIILDKNNQILITQRAKNKHQGGKWEFPGGKVEQGELAEEALIRELDEELDIQIINSEPMMEIRHHYSELSVFLDVYKVTAWQGKVYGKEGQPICWIAREALEQYEFPTANKAILEALKPFNNYLI